MEEFQSAVEQGIPDGQVGLREAQRNRQLEDQIERLQLSPHVHFNPAQSQVSHFRSHGLSPCISGGTPLAHHYRLGEINDIAMDLFRVAAPIRADG